MGGLTNALKGLRGIVVLAAANPLVSLALAAVMGGTWAWDRGKCKREPPVTRGGDGGDSG